MFKRPDVLRTPAEVLAIADRLSPSMSARAELASHVTSSFLLGLGATALGVEAHHVQGDHPWLAGTAYAVSFGMYVAGAARYTMALSHAKTWDAQTRSEL